MLTIASSLLQVIQVDFEGRSPISSDFHGIRQLLHQLFLKADINLSELADIIIGMCYRLKVKLLPCLVSNAFRLSGFFAFSDQNFIGSVVIQSELDDESDDDDDDDGNFNDSGTIFGATTAVNVSKKNANGCIANLRAYLLDKCEKHSPPAMKQQFIDILSDDDKQTGLLINERFINIPPQISVPLLENLQDEINRASKKRDAFKFTHFLMLIKFYRKEKKGSKPAEDIFSNGEEEALCEKCEASFDYSVQSETDSALSGNWREGDSALMPYRKLIFFKSNQLPVLIESVKEFISE